MSTHQQKIEKYFFENENECIMSLVIIFINGMHTLLRRETTISWRERRIYVNEI